jgi:predicted Zn-dependent protease
MVQTMQILQSASGKGGKAPEFLSTHPNPGNRVEYLTKELQSKYPAQAQSGIFGGENFQQNVLSRERVVDAKIDWSNPAIWCITCRNE